MTSSHAFPARQGEPEAVYSWTGRDGSARELSADAHGVVRPDDREGERILEGFGLEIVEGERDAAAASGGSRKRTAKPQAVVTGTRAGDEPGEETEG